MPAMHKPETGVACHGMPLPCSCACTCALLLTALLCSFSYTRNVIQLKMVSSYSNELSSARVSSLLSVVTVTYDIIEVMHLAL